MGSIFSFVNCYGVKISYKFESLIKKPKKPNSFHGGHIKNDPLNIERIHGYFMRDFFQFTYLLHLEECFPKHAIESTKPTADQVYRNPTRSCILEQGLSTVILTRNNLQHLLQRKIGSSLLHRDINK